MSGSLPAAPVDGPDDTINVVTAVPGTKAKAATMDPKPSVVEASTMVKVNDLVHKDFCLTQLIYFQF